MHYASKYNSKIGKCQGFSQINSLNTWKFFSIFQKHKKLGALFPCKEILLRKVKAQKIWRHLEKTKSLA